MVNMHSLLEMQGQFFLLVMLGVFFRRKVVGEEFQHDLSKVVVDLLLPCSILVSFQVELTSEMMRRAMNIFLISLGGQLLAVALAYLAFNRVSPERRSVMQSTTLCSNAGFLGMAVAEGIWTGEGIFFASIFLLPVRIFMWTVGVTFYCKQKGSALFKHLATNPCIIATVLGCVLLLTQWKLPGAIYATCSSLGRCVTGMSMFLVGMTIAHLHWKDFLDPQVLAITALRLGLQPALVLLGCRLTGAESVATSVSVILTAMPAGATVALMATRYNCAEEFAADVVTVSTMLSLITIPLWAIFLT